MLSVEAKIRFRNTSDGGLHRNAVSGMQPSFSVSDDLIMCTVNGKDGVEEFILGETYEVTIDLPYGEKYSDEICKGYFFELNLGGKVIAEGEVLKLSLSIPTSDY